MTCFYKGCIHLTFEGGFYILPLGTYINTNVITNDVCDASPNQRGIAKMKERQELFMENEFRVSHIFFLFIACLFFGVDRLVQYTTIGGPCYQVSEGIASCSSRLWFWFCVLKVDDVNLFYLQLSCMCLCLCLAYSLEVVPLSFWLAGMVGG